MKRTISILLTLVMCLSMMFSLCIESFAAVSWPSLSSSSYCEFTASKQINVYKNTNLSTRGTSSPSKSYNAYISKGDVCKIYKITSSYVQVNYPTSSGNRTGYIKRSDLVSVSAPSSSFTAKAKATTLVSAGGKSYGYTEAGDKVFVCGTSGSYTCVIYTAKSGSRAYKLGWMSAENLAAAKNGTSTSKAAQLVSIALKELGYQGTKKNGTGTGDYTKYGKAIGCNGQPWCASFVSWCAKQAGISTGVIPRNPSTLTMAQESKTYVKWNAKSMNQIKKGDVIFFSKTQQSLTNAKGEKSVCHVGIVYSVDAANNKIVIIEGNTSQDTVAKKTYQVTPKTGYINSWKGHYFCGYIAV